MKTNMAVDSNLNIIIDNQICETDILPKKKIEMWRKILIKGDCQVDGSIFAGSLKLESGTCVFKKAVFLKDDLHLVMNKKKVKNVFESNLQTERSILIENKKDILDSYTLFEADVYSDTITLERCFVYGNVYGKKINIKNCVVLGSVIADRSLDISQSIVGNVKASDITIGDNVTLLYPSLVLENEIDINEKLRILFLDDSEKVAGYTVKLSNSDIQKYKAKEDDDGSIKYVFGTGMRIMNLIPYNASLQNNINILAQKYLQYQISDRDIDKEEKWEKMMLSSIDKVDDFEIKGSFSLREFGELKNDKEYEKYFPLEFDGIGDGIIEALAFEDKDC